MQHRRRDAASTDTGKLVSATQGVTTIEYHEMRQKTAQQRQADDQHVVVEAATHNKDGEVGLSGDIA